MAMTDHTRQTNILYGQRHSPTSVQQTRPRSGDVPLAGGATAFLTPGGGTFFSGSGFLSTTGTLKILFYNLSCTNMETRDIAKIQVILTNTGRGRVDSYR